MCIYIYIYIYLFIYLPFLIEPVNPRTWDIDLFTYAACHRASRKGASRQVSGSWAMAWIHRSMVDGPASAVRVYRGDRGMPNNILNIHVLFCCGLALETPSHPTSKCPSNYVTMSSKISLTSKATKGCKLGFVSWVPPKSNQSTTTCWLQDVS